MAIHGENIIDENMKTIKAIVIIDMLNDFVTGIFGSYNASTEHN